MYFTERVFATRSFRFNTEHCIYFRAMEDLFEQLTRCKDDEQQRNWMLYEDEVTIRDLLQVCILIHIHKISTRKSESKISEI